MTKSLLVTNDFITYSGKLLREKTFCEFRGFVAIHEIFLRKKSYFPPICESFLPQECPTIQHATPPKATVCETQLFGRPLTGAYLGVSVEPGCWQTVEDCGGHQFSHTVPILCLIPALFSLSSRVKKEDMSSGRRLGDLLLALCIEWLILMLQSTAGRLNLLTVTLKYNASTLLASWKKGFDSLLRLAP